MIKFSIKEYHVIFRGDDNIIVTILKYHKNSVLTFTQITTTRLGVDEVDIFSYELKLGHLTLLGVEYCA